MKTRVALLTLGSLSTLAAVPLAPSARAAEPTVEVEAHGEAPGEPHGERPGEAHEEAEGRLPVAEAERPITLPAKILSPELDFDVSRIGGGTYANLTLVGSYGLTDDLTVRGTILPLQLAAPGSSPFRYGQLTENVGPSVGATYRFHRGGIEIGGSLDLGISTIPGASGLLITPGVPVRFHVGKKIRVDTGAYLPISHLTTTDTTRGSSTQPAPGDNFTTNVGLNVPVSFLLDLTEPLHVGVSSAFSVGDVSRAGDTTAIPVSLFTGYAIAGKDGPILDIDPFFAFPTLLTPGGSSATNTADYVIGVAVGGFIYL